MLCCCMNRQLRRQKPTFVIHPVVLHVYGVSVAMLLHDRQLRRQKPTFVMYPVVLHVYGVSVAMLLHDRQLRRQKPTIKMGIGHKID